MEELRQSENASAQPASPGSDILWFKQTIGNACGTIGLLHALANSSASSSIQPDSPLDTLFKKARATEDVDERADILVNSKELQTVHEATASQGQSQAPEDLDNVILHFVCFVRDREGELIELDGSGGRKGPIKRGRKVASQEDLLPVAVEYVKDNYVSVQASKSEGIASMLLTTRPSRIWTDGAQSKRGQLQPDRPCSFVRLMLHIERECKEQLRNYCHSCPTLAIVVQRSTYTWSRMQATYKEELPQRCPGSQPSPREQQPH